MTLEWAVDYIEYGGFPNDGSRGNEAWSVIKKYIEESQKPTTNKANIDITNLKRYDVVDDVNCNSYEVFESDDGDYVKFEDIKKLLCENN